MSDAGLRRDWTLQLQRFEQRIATLRQKITQAKEGQRREATAKLDELARRYRELREGSDEIKEARERFRAESEADREKVAQDLSAALTEFIEWVDRDYHGKPPSL
jgi:chromosome segregation ATPase